MHEELDKAVSVLIENDVDMIIIEYFFYIQVNYLICHFKQTVLPPQEMEWAIEVCLTMGKTVAASICIGPEGDMHGVPAEECAIRVAKAGGELQL